MILVTGGAGFIGSNFVHQWIANEQGPIVNLDKLTYAGNLNNLDSLMQNTSHHFVHGDIGNRELVRSLLEKHRPKAIIHFAAETHVDRSLHSPESFVQTNVLGSFCLLDETYTHWKNLPESERNSFRFLNVSTDEVYGSIPPDALPVRENAPYAPNSPYAASKASFDHFARSYHSSYGFPILTTHCTNNYGPYQLPEKLIPLVIVNALQGKPLPIYGDGLQIRDWIYVLDHCKALTLILDEGIPGESYNIGAESNPTNLHLVKTLCNILDDLKPESPHRPHASLIRHVKDRPGHDRRYALDCSKIRNQLGWEPQVDLETSLRSTVQWYLDHQQWIENVISGEYRTWIAIQYG